jgi:two-component system sensor histidine kinase MtrB
MLRHRWQRSILFRVIFSTVAFTVVFIALIGTLLYSQISNDIYREKTNASVSEAESLFGYDQGQLYATQYLANLKISAVVDQIFRPGAPSVGTAPREVVLLGSLVGKSRDVTYNRVSNNLEIRSIPNSFRKLVQKSTSTHWLRTRVYYSDGTSQSAIIVGSEITIPPASPYELYYVFILNEQQTILGFILHLLWLTGFFSLLVIGLLSWYVTRQAVNPLRDAAEIAEEFTAGDLHRRMDVQGQDEMARLAISFNEMAVSMQQQISRLENLSRLQQRFVSDVSHELRTPLTTIRMASGVITENAHKLDPAAQRSAELLASQIARFESLLTDLLEVSRFDASASILESKEISINELIRQTIDHLQPGDITQIKLHFPEEDVLAEVDPRRIERVFRNLIANAIDHCEGKPIDITLVATDKEFAVGVRDYGIGFNERDTHRLFDRFWRADPSRSRIRGGTGLGLSIALDDAKLHQGLLKAWGSPQQGANFVLTIPRVPGIAIESEPLQVEPSRLESTSFLSFDEDDI